MRIMSKGQGIKNNTKEHNSYCRRCSKAFYIKPFALKRGRGKYCSRKCYGQDRSDWMKDKAFNPAYTVDFTLENNPNWRGGKSFEPYPLGWTRTFKEQVRLRDKYQCVLCGKPEVENNRRLDVHHIDYNKNNLQLDNLVSLCMSCHRQTNFHREKWQSHFDKEVMPNERND